MTVTYTQDLATEKVGGFFRLLFRWRGSIYSVVYGELSIFLCFYSVLSIIYRKLLTDPQKVDFEKLCIFFESYEDYIPVTFIVGFYVIRIIVRRWTQWENIPLPDRLAFNVSCYLHGADLRCRMLRRALVRYTNLAITLCFCDICVPVRKRFPTLDHLIIAGLMTAQEKELYLKTMSSKDSNWWIPFHWAYTLTYKANQEGKLQIEGLMRIQDDLLDLRQKCWVLFSHDWIPVPMVYTQVAALSVYLFMFTCLLGRQYLDPSKNYPKHQIDLYVPFFTIFQLIFFLGWMKVAEVLICPMGMDADDFEMNYIIDRNLKLSYSLVDYNHNKLPPLEKDVHWDVEEPEMPHTMASLGVRDNPFVGTAVTLQKNDEDARLAEPPLSETGVAIGQSKKVSRQSSQSPSRKSSSLWNSMTRLLGSRSHIDSMVNLNGDSSSPKPRSRKMSVGEENNPNNLSSPDQEVRTRKRFNFLSRSREAPLTRLTNIDENELLMNFESREASRRESVTSRSKMQQNSPVLNEAEMQMKLAPFVVVSSPSDTPRKTSVAETSDLKEVN